MAMTERTTWTLTLYRTSPATRPTWQQILTELVGDLTDAADLAQTAPIQLTAEIACGSLSQLALRLAEVDRDAIWRMHADPKYEWPGQLAWHHPGLPLDLSECDATGEPLLGARRARSPQPQQPRLRLRPTRHRGHRRFPRNPGARVGASRSIARPA